MLTLWTGEDPEQAEDHGSVGDSKTGHSRQRQFFSDATGPQGLLSLNHQGQVRAAASAPAPLVNNTAASARMTITAAPAEPPSPVPALPSLATKALLGPPASRDGRTAAVSRDGHTAAASSGIRSDPSWYAWGLHWNNNPLADDREVSPSPDLMRE